MPVAGFINTGAANTSAGRVAAFRKGLSEAGYAEGQNVSSLSTTGWKVTTNVCRRWWTIWFGVAWL
jgi:hypothetical protein